LGDPEGEASRVFPVMGFPSFLGSDMSKVLGRSLAVYFSILWEEGLLKYLNN
jgi:hypothetical protein